MAKPPPWNHTSTGRVPPSRPPDHTLSTRQSSDSSPSADQPWGRVSGCGHDGPNAIVSRTERHGSGGTGGRKRLGPPVGPPYGIPRNVCTPSSSSPLIGPALVWT